MAEATLMQAAGEFLDSLRDEERAASQGEVQRFVRWCGADRDCRNLRGQEVANYAEMLTGGVTDPGARADMVKKFLAFAKKAGYTSTNLGTHLRLKKTAKTVVRTTNVKDVQLTPEQRAAFEAELESLKAQRPRIRQDIQRAMADKDFRENAPLDAARDRQGYVEGRIRELEATLAQAVIVEQGRVAASDAIDIGATVHLRNLQSGAETTYTVVRPGEANAARGLISLESPVGRALLERHTGEEVEVAAPSGTLRFRIERIES